MNYTDDNESQNQSDDNQVRKIYDLEMKGALEIAIWYIEQQPTRTPVGVLNLKNWRDFAGDRCKNNIKQNEMNFFHGWKDLNLWCIVYSNVFLFNCSSYKKCVSAKIVINTIYSRLKIL